MRKFDYSDYVKNPLKYGMFKTAMVSNTIINVDGQVNAGTIVGVAYLGASRNQLHKRMEPLYKLTTGDICFANGLSDFTL